MNHQEYINFIQNHEFTDNISFTDIKKEINREWSRITKVSYNVNQGISKIICEIIIC